jgi:hypothetical protein
MGRRNPIAALVVAPKIVMASPRLVRAMETTKQMVTRDRVASRFYLSVNMLPGGRKSCSIVSLQGRIVSGVDMQMTS